MQCREIIRLTHSAQFQGVARDRRAETKILHSLIVVVTSEMRGHMEIFHLRANIPSRAVHFGTASMVAVSVSRVSIKLASSWILARTSQKLTQWRQKKKSVDNADASVVCPEVPRCEW